MNTPLLPYEFEGISPEGNIVEGILDAPNRIQAMKVLIHQHRISPQYVCEEQATAEEKRYMRSGGMNELFSLLTPDELAFIHEQTSIKAVMKQERNLWSEKITLLIAETEKFIMDHPKLTDDELIRLRDHIKNLSDALDSTEPEKFQWHFTGLKRYLNQLRKNSGEIIDPALQKFFDGIETGDIVIYAHRVRLMPDVRGKLLIHELRRALIREHRSDAFTKIRMIIRGGKIYERHEHHPIWMEIHRFLGALFCFYLILFALSYYANVKQFGFSLVYLETLTRNILISKIIIVLFLCYAALTLKLYFFQPTKWVNRILAAIAILSSLCILIL